MTGLGATVAGSLAIAAVSTLGDFIWATWIPRHMAVFGLTHGTLLFLAIGFVLGTISGRAARGALGGAAIGFLAAGTFYVLSPVVGFSAMFAAWMAVWLALAWLYGRLNAARIDIGHRHDIRIDARAIAGRGALAAIASGVAFYAISGIWRPFNPQGWDYAVHFGAWTLAYLPGFGALFLSRR
ncbi:MAG: hypothetical protein HY657_00750 [Acidobacteria bacterium]|nr:hypothetical protein [Acidobacteriota bacterium]